MISEDSGSCGQVPWAIDTITRTFEVKDNGDGTFTLRVKDHGTFVTTGPVSPGACDTSDKHGEFVRAGVTGTLNGKAEGTVTGGTFNPAGECLGNCFMSVFTKSFFGPNAQFTCVSGPAGSCDFKWEYSSSAQDLIYHHWTNSSKGDKGDIATLGVE